MDTEKKKSLYRLSDEEVVKAAQKGDKDALDHIIARYRNYVYSKANTYFLVGAERDDVAQEGFIGLYKAVKDYDDQCGSSFKHFASLCISRQIITAIKAATRKKHIPLNSYVSLDNKEGEPEDISLVISENENPESIIISQEEMEISEFKINRILSKMEMQVLMYYTEGMSYEEIAAAIKKPVKSVDNALSRIKKKLINELK